VLQQAPHLLLDMVAVCDAVRVNFVAAAGAAGCCGKPFLLRGMADIGERWILTKLERALAIGAKVQVNWCTACQNTSSASAARRALVQRG
jgi:hypothetical protein